MKKKIVILGSTGSIGKTLIDILQKDKNNFTIELLAIDSNYNELLKQINLFKVKNIIISNYNIYLKIKKKFKNKNIRIYNDFEEIDLILKNKKIDYTMSSISGIAGLLPTLKIIKYSKVIAIANKEAIICGWSLIKKELNIYKTRFIPVDSEHFSVWSLLNNAKNDEIDKVFLTASGGPFINYELKKFKSITTRQALKHPNWKMGKKISIDSATMMNKVFEIIEAKKIFNFDYDKLKILVHPKSYVHAIVKFNNGLTKILIHDTSMAIPIFNSLYNKGNKKFSSNKLNIEVLNNLDFKNINLNRFPVVAILKKMPIKDSLYDTVIVSANEALVQLFLKGKIKFNDISKRLLNVASNSYYTKFKTKKPKNINDILDINKYVSFKINSKGV